MAINTLTVLKCSLQMFVHCKINVTNSDVKLTDFKNKIQWNFLTGVHLRELTKESEVEIVGPHGTGISANRNE